MSLPQNARKRPEELAARYRLEPAIREVFVEGRIDCGLLRRFLRSMGLCDVAVYEISSVDIPPARLIPAGHPDNARGRVIFLAFFMESEIDSACRAITCVADRDYDLVLGRHHRCPFLLFFDHSSLEMYAFDTGILVSLLEAVAPALEREPPDVLNDLEQLLKCLFAIRATNISLNLGLTWLASFYDSCAICDHGIEFDENNFVDRYLGRNGRLGERDRFLRTLREIKARIEGDRRLFIRGHDFVHCLSWYLRLKTSKSSQLLRPENLHQLLLAYLEPSRLQVSPFFRELVTRVR